MTSGERLFMKDSRTFKGENGFREKRTEKRWEVPSERRFDAVPPDAMKERDEYRIEGRNAVLEAIKAERTLDKVYVAGGDTDATLSYIISLARQSGAAISRCDRRKLDAMSETKAHQGVIAVAAAHVYATVDEMLASAAAAGKPPLLILCDGITDPHNLGAIIRTAEVSGAHGVIIPKNRSVGLTPAVDKASAGALEYLPVARVSNLSTCIADLKKRGIWIFGAAAQSEISLFQADFKRACAIVIGSEGDGISRVVRDACDYTVGIPMFGKISSLNASNAAAVLLYEAVRQREGI
jgi:23S rRNA (guanosine2251-2'-O)-methyltransferase